jgi:hypothetical protein
MQSIRLFMCQQSGDMILRYQKLTSSLSRPFTFTIVTGGRLRRLRINNT